MLTQQISGVLLTNNPYQVTAHFCSSSNSVNPYVTLSDKLHVQKLRISGKI